MMEPAGGPPNLLSSKRFLAGLGLDLLGTLLLAYSLIVDRSLLPAGIALMTGGVVLVVTGILAARQKSGPSL